MIGRVEKLAWRSVTPWWHEIRICAPKQGISRRKPGIVVWYGGMVCALHHKTYLAGFAGFDMPF
jgi:hypothetical protein